jgi:translation initiation factor 1 (eIF-1/SUI1)
MNPLEDEDDNKKNKITAIKITLNKMGNKQVTEIKGWLNLTKEEITAIKKELHTNMSMNNNIIKLQGNHVEFIKNKLIEKGISEEIITIVE